MHQGGFVAVRPWMQKLLNNMSLRILVKLKLRAYLNQGALLILLESAP
jgi:hypothetical protein